MMLTQLLAAGEAAFPMLQQAFVAHLSWVGHFVRVIVESVGSVGWGVIVFTLVLKLITTPFDIYQRVSMRKQNLVMKKMQPELEKLQKQYANDKTMYNAKIVELQKKNGYSMMGACLPMLISFAILIIAVTGFQAYAQYANLGMYREMAESFNEAVRVYSADTQDESTLVYTEFEDNGVRKIRVESSAPSSYLFYTYSADANTEETFRKDYFIDLNKFYYEQSDSAFKQELGAFVASYKAEKAAEGKAVNDSDACVAWFVNLGAAAAAERFQTIDPGFLWIKNVWYPDVSYRHPIQDYSSFVASISSKKITDDYGNQNMRITDIFLEGEYVNLTQDLVEEQSQPNGYYILIVLTLALMVVSQLVTMKSSKESTQFQSVDGQSGKRQQTFMMVFMLMMYAITGFLWTAAFSIYIAVSSIIGILITLISNLVLGRIFKKKEEEEIKAKYTRTVPWKKK